MGSVVAAPTITTSLTADVAAAAMGYGGYYGVRWVLWGFPLIGGCQGVNLEGVIK